MRTFFLLFISHFSLSSVFGQSNGVTPHNLRVPYDSTLAESMKNQYSILDTSERHFDIEINELLVNETITKAGNEFYELFYSKWSWPKQLKASFIIVIKEKPLRGNMTLASLLVNDVSIFEQPLQPRLDYLESIVDVAVMQATGYLNNYYSIIRSLEREEIQGSGIY